MPLEPLPETRDALLSVSQWAGRDLTAELKRHAELVANVVQSLVGISLALVRDGLTFTLSATQEHLDGVLHRVEQRLGGPWVDAALQDSTILGGYSDAGVLDEQRWAEFARTGAAHGVLSTLSLPIHVGGQVVGSANLYAGTPHAFAGKESRLAAILGAWAPGAVHNADLSFSTRAEARRAPQLLEELAVLDQATGVVVEAHGVDIEAARQIIADAAHRAGQDELEVARELIRPFLHGNDAT